MWGLTALGTRGRGPRSGRAWSSQGLLVAIHTWSSAIHAARKLQITNYLAKIRVEKTTTLKMIKQLSLSYLQVALTCIVLPTTPSGLVRPGRTRDRK